MLSAIAALPSSEMVTMASALASSRWPTIDLRREGLAAFAGFAGLALAAAGLTASFGFAVPLGRARFFAGAFRGLVLLCQAAMHQTAGSRPLG